MQEHLEHRYAPAGVTTSDAEKVSSILQERLASLIDLSLILKHIHWNVIGPGFMSMHKLMDNQVEVTRALVDEVAERISTLGGVAAGLAEQVAQRREAEDDYPLGRALVAAHLGALDKVYERLGKGHRDAMGEIDELDPITGDLLIDQSRRLEMQHWFIRAHLSDTSGRLVTEDTVTEMEGAVAAVYALQPVEESSDINDSADPAHDDA